MEKNLTNQKRYLNKAKNAEVKICSDEKLIEAVSLIHDTGRSSIEMFARVDGNVRIVSIAQYND